MKTILITGINGFIGEYLGKKFIKYNNIIGIDCRENKRNNWNKFYHFDIRNKNEMEMIFKENKIDIVIHLAAEKTLIKCQENKKEAYEINYISSINLYEIAKKNKSKFIFISSDQVFDGKKGNYRENDKCSPINYYGELKTKVEEYMLNDRLYNNYTICRTALDFWKIPLIQKDSFNKIKENDKLLVQGFIVEHVIYKLKKKEKIILPENEFMNPTSLELFFRQLKSIIDKDLKGILHCCGGERISRYDFGKKIAQTFNLDHSFISPEDSKDILRPKDVSFNTEISEVKIGFKYDNIKQMLVKLKKNLEE